MSSSHSNHRPNERRPRPFALPSLVAAGLAALVLACNPSETKSTTPGAAPISAPSFDGNRLLGILDALASDALGGRYTLHDDIREAAAVITSRYETAGVVPGTEDGFLLEYDLVVGIDPEPGTTLTLGDDQVPATALIPRPEGAVGDAAGPLVFVGYGITRVGFDELAEVYIDGAVAVMLANAPPSTDEAGTKPRRPPRLARRLDGLAKAGAVAVVLVDDPLAVRPTTGRELPPLPDTTEDHPLRRRVDIPVVQVDTPTADALIGAKGVPALSDLQAKLDEVQQPQSRAITGVRARVTTQFTPRTVQAPNILAIVPGTDLADEIVLLGAHYDHIGTDAPGHGHCEATPSIEGSPDAICNGADDNASGSAIVAELAMAMTAAAPPRRTLVFAHFSGEELGLLGSRALAARLDQQAPFAGRRIVAMVNIDMVGRLRDRLTVSGVGSSSAWMEILDEIGPRDMRVMYDRSLTTRSDHAPFYELGIPAIFLFTEVHDDYHAPGDESAAILREGVLSVAGLVEAVVDVLAQGRPISFSPPARPEEGLVPALPGDDPSTIVKEVGPAAAG